MADELKCEFPGSKHTCPQSGKCNRFCLVMMQTLEELATLNSKINGVCEKGAIEAMLIVGCSRYLANRYEDVNKPPVERFEKQIDEMFSDIRSKLMLYYERHGRAVN